MANKEIKIEFPEAKLEALEFFMNEKNEDVEHSLKEHLDKLYEKNVPVPVKKFVEKKMESESVEGAENQEEAVDVNQRQTRLYRRRTGRQAEAADAPAEQDEPVDEENVQEEQVQSGNMTMGM